MCTYFAFSDESGNYVERISKEKIKQNPFFLRSTLCIKSSEWKTLKTCFMDLKAKYDLAKNAEIKWSYAQSLESKKKNSHEIKDSDHYYFLKDYCPNKLRNFYREALKILPKLSYCTVFLQLQLIMKTIQNQKRKY